MEAGLDLGSPCASRAGEEQVEKPKLVLGGESGGLDATAG